MDYGINRQEKREYGANFALHEKMNLNFEKYGIELGRVSSRATNVKVFCPACHDRRSDKRDKSLSVNVKTGEFNCHYCGFKGVAVERESNWMGVRRAPEPVVYKLPKPRTSGKYSEGTLGWFQSRGISEATLCTFRVAEGMAWMPQYEGREVQTVQFCYYEGETLVNVKYRTADKKFRMEKDARLLPYNIDSLRGESRCIVTEGEMDALTWGECGWKAVTSVPNGAGDNTDYLDDYIDEFFEDKELIYISVDTDKKGLLLREALLRRFGLERCRIITYGEECKDINELYLRGGKMAVEAAYRDAVEVNPEGIYRVLDFEGALDDLYEHGLQQGLTLGHSALDPLLSLEPKRLMVVTGVPGSGKSEFIDEMAERLNIRYGWRFGYFSPENQPLQYHAAKLIEKFTGKKFRSDKLSREAYAKVKAHLQANFFFIAPKESYTLDAVLERAGYLVRRHGINSVVIDPFNRLEMPEEGMRNETLYISRVLDRLTNFAQQNNVLVILMAHPTKMRRDQNGVQQVPTLYDISGSANFYNKADFGLVVHRDKGSNTVEVKVEKVKFRHLGEPGSAIFRYNINNGRYVRHIEGAEPNWDNSNHLEQGLPTDRQTLEAPPPQTKMIWEEEREENLPF